MKATKASLIFATTTLYPDQLGKQMRSPGKPKIYNEVALKIMQKNKIAVDDLYAFVLPSMEAFQRPKNIHFTAIGSKILGEEVANSILRSSGK